MSTTCYHCFREKSSYGPCSFCGYDPTDAEKKYPLALNPGSILNGRYTVGRVLGQGGFGITYIAQDLLLKKNGLACQHPMQLQKAVLQIMRKPLGGYVIIIAPRRSALKATSSGLLNGFDDVILSDNNAVRPAMWVDWPALCLEYAEQAKGDNRAYIGSFFAQGEEELAFLTELNFEYVDRVGGDELLARLEKAMAALHGESGESLDSSLSLLPVHGAFIAEVLPGSAAEKAGLIGGELITKIGNIEISSSKDLRRALLQFSANDTADITVYHWRENEEVTLDITFDAAPEEIPATKPFGLFS